MRTGVLLHEKTRQWRWVVVGTALLVVLVSLSLVVGVGTTGSARGEAVITGGLAFVPSRGEYRISKEYAFSNFLWDQQGFLGGGEDAYEHEFLVQNTGFARYANHWTSNLPQAYPDIEDNAHSSTVGVDEFVIGSENAELIVPGQWYWTFVDLSDQDRLVGTSQTILEAEMLRDWPWPIPNDPIAWHPIATFTAPISNGTWGGPASPLSHNTVPFQNQTSAKADASVDAYIVEKRELLRTLASDNPAATVRATISLAHYANLVATQTFLERHQISAEAMWYMSAQHNFSGGFAVASTLSASAENVIKSLQDNMVFTRQEWQNASAEERLILERSLAKHQMMLEAFRRNKVMIYGIDVVAKTGALYAMQDDPMVRLVDVRLPVNAATAVPGRRRPLQPAAGTER